MFSTTVTATHQIVITLTNHFTFKSVQCYTQANCPKAFFLLIFFSNFHKQIEFVCELVHCEVTSKLNWLIFFKSCQTQYGGLHCHNFFHCMISPNNVPTIHLGSFHRIKASTLKLKSKLMKKRQQKILKHATKCVNKTKRIQKKYAKSSNFEPWIKPIM